jgi:L-aspartate oxidase
MGSAPARSSGACWARDRRLWRRTIGSAQATAGEAREVRVGGIRANAPGPVGATLAEAAHKPSMTDRGARTPVRAAPSSLGELDVLVVGSGVAGLAAALRLVGVLGPVAARPRRSGRRAGEHSGSGALKVGVLTKAELAASATSWAQGGVAAVLPGDEDSTDLHLADTLRAGAGLCDPDAVRLLVEEGPRRVVELIALGANFDRSATGELLRAREGGHSAARVLHAGGVATGAEVERALVEALRASVAVVAEGWLAVDLLVEEGRCRGILACSPEGQLEEVRATHVVLATGGAGQLFSVTTNPPEATGDGVAMALRAGVEVADVEFVQFHPTALHHVAMPRPLVSEALRGHGARILDVRGERVVDELAPRDVVARAMARRMAEQGVEHLWLDATGIEDFKQRFPTLAQVLNDAGLDPTRELIPVAPAAHYVSGGLLTDLDGATTLPGLWAAGEAACTGVHGANRLASNSLLEGMVFGARVAEAIRSGKEAPEATGALGARIERRRCPLGPASGLVGQVARLMRQAKLGFGGDDVRKARLALAEAMTEGAGVVRTAESLRSAADALVATVRWLTEHLEGSRSAQRDRTKGGARSPRDLPTFACAGARAVIELANLVTVGAALVDAATARFETRGSHCRLEAPEPDERFRLRLVHGGG